MRRLVPVVAALVLIAPSCPRDYGPSDYAPDASWPYGQYAAGSDLVYVAGTSAKGDSVYVIAMPGGDVVARIDGPDRRGWVFADPDFAYYPMHRAVLGTMTVHRHDLRAGRRERVLTDDRRSLSMFETASPIFSPLVLSADRREIVLTRVLEQGPTAWLGRYDLESGALRGEIAWPLRSPQGGVRLAAIPGAYVVVTFEADQYGPRRQRMLVVDGSFRDIATLSAPEDLADRDACSPQLAPLKGGGWATVCWWAGPQATVVFLDAKFRVVSRTTFGFRTFARPPNSAPPEEVLRGPRPEREGSTPAPPRTVVGGAYGPPERLLAWAAGEESVGILTDRGTYLRVALDGQITESPIGSAQGETYVNVAREIDGTVLAHWTMRIGGTAVSELVRIDLAAGRVLRRAPFAGTHPDFALAGDRLYALVWGPPASGPEIQRLDPETLTVIGTPVPVPQRDDIHVHGLAAAVRGR
jgi:hypothetical protein